MIPAGDDDVIVPVVGLDGGGDLFGLGDAAGDFFFAVGGPNDFFAALGHDAAATGAAGFVIEDAGKAIDAVEIGLIAGDNEVIALQAAILDAGVAAGGDFVGEAQLK